MHDKVLTFGRTTGDNGFLFKTSQWLHRKRITLICTKTGRKCLGFKLNAAI